MKRRLLISIVLLAMLTGFRMGDEVLKGGASIGSARIGTSRGSAELIEIKSPKKTGRNMTVDEMNKFLIGVWEHRTTDPNELDEWISFDGEKQSNITWWKKGMDSDTFDLQFNSRFSYYIDSYNEENRTILIKTESLFGDPYENRYTFSEFGNEMTHENGEVFKRLGDNENAIKFYEAKSGTRYLPPIQ